MRFAQYLKFPKYLPEKEFHTPVPKILKLEK